MKGNSLRTLVCDSSPWPLQACTVQGPSAPHMAAPLTIAQRMEALKVAQGGDDKLALGGGMGGMGATAAPSAPSSHFAKLGEVEETANVRGFKPDYGERSPLRATQPALDAAAAARRGRGAVLASGWLQKSGKGLKAQVFEPRFCVLYAEPSLAFFENESLQAAKGGPVQLGGATVQRKGELVLLNEPEEFQASAMQRFQQTKLQAESLPEAERWRVRIEAAIAGLRQPMPSNAFQRGLRPHEAVAGEGVALEAAVAAMVGRVMGTVVAAAEASREVARPPPERGDTQRASPRPGWQHCRALMEASCACMTAGSKCTLRSAPARPLRLLGARLAALGSPALPE